MLHRCVPGRLKVQLNKGKLRTIYLQAAGAGLAPKALPDPRHLVESLGSHLTREAQKVAPVVRWLHLSFLVVDNHELESRPEQEGPVAAFAIDCSEHALLDVQPALYLPKKESPTLAKVLWSTLTTALDLLGTTVSPAKALFLASYFSWEGFDDEGEYIRELIKRGEDPNAYEFVKKADLQKQIPIWVLETHKQKITPKLEAKLAGHKLAKPLLQLRRTIELVESELREGHRNLEGPDSLPVAFIPWEEAPLLAQLEDDYYNNLQSEYQTYQAMFPFAIDAPGSFSLAWQQFLSYLRLLKATEDLLDTLLAPKEGSPLRLVPKTEKEVVLAATHAVLVYAPDQHSGETGMVTIHDIARTADRRTVVLPGKPASLRTLYRLFSTLKPESAFDGLIPERLLKFTPVEMLWYKPSHPAPIFFKTDDPELNALSGKEVRHPALTFRVTANSFHVAALENDIRPSLDTKLFRAPYYNLNEKGLLCTGSVQLPKNISPHLLAEWESVFFQSAFTHANCHHAPITRHPKGHKGLWIEQAASLQYDIPAQRLVPVPMDLKGFLARP